MNIIVILTITGVVTYCIGASIKESDRSRPNQLSRGLSPKSDDLIVRRTKINESVHVINKTNNQRATNKDLIAEPRKKKKKEKGMMSKIMPMMWIPFMLQSAMIPMAITSLKFMLLKSMIIGKIAILLMIINALRRSNNTGGVFSHNIHVQHEEKELSKSHYGYSGEEEEYGAYINKRSTR